jgi:hypothetical protein
MRRLLAKRGEPVVVTAPEADVVNECASAS